MWRRRAGYPSCRYVWLSYRWHCRPILHVFELESQLASRSLEVEDSPSEIKSTECLFPFCRRSCLTQVPRCLKREISDSQSRSGMYCCWDPRAAIETSFQSLTASESALQSEVQQLARHVKEFGAEWIRMGWDCDRRVDDVLFCHDALKSRLVQFDGFTTLVRL